MKLEDFNKLTDEEKGAILKAAEDDAASVTDLTAERDSLKSENDTLRETITKSTEELAKTKELNFTLARRIDGKPKSDPEKTLLDFIKGE